jgi:hypothetical protein
MGIRADKPVFLTRSPIRSDKQRYQMAKRDVLKDLEKQHGDLNKVIPPLVNQGGQAFAAQQLNTTQATISNWLKDNQYEKKVEWVKVTELEGAQ